MKKDDIVNMVARKDTSYSQRSFHSRIIRKQRLSYEYEISLSDSLSLSSFKSLH